MSLSDELNFLLSNRIPRALLTRFMGWYSKLEMPFLVRPSLEVWEFFGGDLRLDEAKTTRFKSLHECFVRELRAGVRPIDSAPLAIVSPADAIVGMAGRIEGTTVYQAKGFPYRLEDLVADPDFGQRYANGTYVTLRLRSCFYHRFHAPDDLTVDRVTYFSGDTWNVNPIALTRIERLFCKNERAAVEMTLADGTSLTIVAVAAILVASIRLHCLDATFDARSTPGSFEPTKKHFARGEEMGWFEHGSTLLVFSSRPHDLDPEIVIGRRIDMGTPLFRRDTG